MKKNRPPDEHVLIRAYCPVCWFNLESKFHAGCGEPIVRGFFQREHNTRGVHRQPPCAAAVRIPRYEALAATKTP